MTRPFGGSTVPPPDSHVKIGRGAEETAPDTTDTPIFVTSVKGNPSRDRDPTPQPSPGRNRSERCKSGPHVVFRFFAVVVTFSVEGTRLEWSFTGKPPTQNHLFGWGGGLNQD